MFCSSVKILSLASGAGWPRVFLLFETGEKENLGSYICNVCRRRPGGNLATWTYPRIRERSPPPPPLVLTHNTNVCDVNWWIVKSPKAFRHCLFCAGRTFYLGYHSKRFDICWVYYTLDNNAWLLFFFLVKVFQMITKKWNGIDYYFFVRVWVDMRGQKDIAPLMLRCVLL